jgi:hypothetical protein
MSAKELKERTIKRRAAANRIREQNDRNRGMK